MNSREFYSTLQVDDEIQRLARDANKLRRELVKMLYTCGGGHFGGSLSALDIILTLYDQILNVSPGDPPDPLRDRFILSKGHAASALYVVLAHHGFFPHDLLRQYGSLDSLLQGHPDMRLLPSIDFSTGSLGQGISAGLGMAIALREQGTTAWVVVGDGECQEGQIWEAATLAAQYNIDNINVVIDTNGFQEYGWPTHGQGHAEPVSGLAEKWKAFGWHTIEVDGHNHEELIQAFHRCLERDAKPHVVVAHTIKGYGFPLIEQDPVRFHCTQISAGEYTSILGEAPP
jgi:transketolase